MEAQNLPTANQKIPPQSQGFQIQKINQDKALQIYRKLHYLDENTEF